jgi:hypothetical protein
VTSGACGCGSDRSLVGLPLIVADGYLTASTGARLGETLAPRDPKRALDVAETALEVARAGGFRALEAELLRVKASALLSLGVEVAEAAANEGYELAQQLGLGPEQGHGCELFAASCGQGRCNESRSSEVSRARSFVAERPQGAAIVQTLTGPRAKERKPC